MLPRTPNYPLLYPKYPLLRTIRAPLKGQGGVLVASIVQDAHTQTSTYLGVDCSSVELAHEVSTNENDLV